MFEVFAAFFSALGLGALLWMVFGALLLPIGTEETLQICLSATGDGETLEQTVRGVSWLCRAGLLRCRVCILDEGLTPKGRAQVEHLCAGRFVGIRFVHS